LSKHLRRPGPGVAGYLERAGAALHALHRLPQAVAGPLQPHDFAAEARMAVRASDHIPALLPSVGAAIDALLDRAREVHERLPQEPPTVRLIARAQTVMNDLELVLGLPATYYCGGSDDLFARGNQL